MSLRCSSAIFQKALWRPNLANKSRLTPAAFSTTSAAVSSTENSLVVGPPQKSLIPPGNCQFGEDFVSVPLLSRIPVSHNSSVLRFGLPDESLPLNLSTCACILAQAQVDNEAVIRPYTPISTNVQVGYFDLLVKNYGAQGTMSTQLHEMEVGDTVDFKHIAFNVKIQAPFEQSHIVMLAGGTGIAPMIQALHAILGDVESKAKVTLLYGSQTSDDILGFDLLKQWEQDSPERLEVVHVLSDEDGGDKPGIVSGFVDKPLLEKHVPDVDSDETLVLVCGPPPMYEALCGPRDAPELTGILSDMGCSAERVYKF
ncbi:MAG: hypothetical protein SGBAC_011487 [Bacillariaceae sp.]